MSSAWGFLPWASAGLASIEASAAALGWRQIGNVHSVLLDGAWLPLIKADGRPTEPLPSEDGCNCVWYRRQGPNSLWNDDDTAHGGVGNINCLQLDMAF
jgi:hypothetical protein